MNRLSLNVRLTALALLLSVCQMFAGNITAQPSPAAKENILPIGFDACSLSLGREFPGAKGALKEDSGANVLLEYDFSGGGRYVGAEIGLPVRGLKSYTLTFEAKQVTRLSLVILQPGKRIEIKRRQFGKGVHQIVIDASTQFIQSGASVDGSASKVLFRIEKSTNAAQKGTVVLKDFRFFGKMPEPPVSSKPAADAPVQEIRISPAMFHRSHGLEYPGSKTMQIQVKDGIKLEYDFTNGGRYVGAELDLEYAGATHFEIIFDAPHKVRVFGRAHTRTGFYETKTVYFEPGKNLKFSISANGPWRKARGTGKVDGILGSDVERVMLCVEKAPGTPVKGNIVYKKVISYGAPIPRGQKARPAQTLPEPVYLFTNADSKGVKNAERVQGAPGFFAADVRFGDTEFEIDRNKLNPEAFTISAWIYAGEQNSLYSGDAGMYRNIILKKTTGSFVPNTEIQFSLCKMVPQLAFQNEQGVWSGVMRYGKDFRSGDDGKDLKPIISLPRVRENEWTLVTATFQKGTIRTYINDEFVLESRYPNRREMYFSSSPLKIGNLFGMVDHLALYNTALTPQEVALSYQNAKDRYAGKKITLARRTDKFFATFDRDFKRLLPITAKYLKNLPARETYDHTPAFTLGKYNGQVMIHRDGKPEPSFCVVPVNDWYPNSSEAVADFAAAGTPYTQLVFTYNQKHGGWGDSLDFSELEAKIEQNIKYHPNSRILIRTRLTPPPWWKSLHRDELDRTENGRTSNEPSMSSSAWLKDAAKALRLTIEHFEKHPVYGPRIAGYIIGGGRANEWYWFASNRGWIDYNPKNVRRFREWLRKHYNGDVNALRKAWNNKNVTFETANIPSGKLRAASEYGFFRDLKKSMPVADHLRYMSDVISGDISYLAAEARKSLKTPKLLGVFNGYSTWHDDLSNQGFQYFHKVLADSNIDFITAPVCYLNRRAGFAGDFMNGYTASIRLHGKLYYDEADMRTNFCNDTNIYKTTTLEETRSVHWRSWGNAMTQGTTLWWLLLAGNNTFHDPDLIADIARMSKMEKEVISRDRSPVAEIAVFSDDESMLYVNAKQKMFHAFNREARERLAHIGAPMDFYMLSDITNPAMPDYKIYVFLNAYYMTPEKRDAIHKKLAKNHATAVWCHAPGYLSPKGNRYSTMKELTGFTFDDQFRITRTPLKFTDSGKALLPDMAASAGEEYSMSPIFFVKPNAADTVLAHIAKLPVLVKRKESFGTSVFSAVPPTAALLRDLCRANGIHVYIDSNDVLRANESMVMVHASSEGIKKISIPWQSPVRELISGKLFKQAGRIELPMKFGETAIFVPVSEK